MAKMTKDMQIKMAKRHHDKMERFGEPRRKEGRTISAYTQSILDAAQVHHEQAMQHMKVSRALISSLLVGAPDDVKADLALVLASWNQADLPMN
jgi:hypothetical protein